MSPKEKVAFEQKLANMITIPAQKATLYVCGARGSRSMSGIEFVEFGGLTTSYVIKMGSYAILVDLGTGIETSKHLINDCTHVDVLITHFHSDHILGVLNPGLFPDTAHVRFFSSPMEGRTCKEIFETFVSPPFWAENISFDRYDFVEFQPGETLNLHCGCRVKTILSAHLEKSILYRVLGDWGDASFIFDYEHGAIDISDFIKDIELMIYDGMFSPAEYDKFKGWGHSHWGEGARLANENNVGHVIITHHGPTKDDGTLRAEELEAKQLFRKLRFARMGMTESFYGKGK